MAHNANELLEKYRKGTCTPEERRLVEHYLNKKVQDSSLFPDERRMQASADRLDAAFRQHTESRRSLHIGRWLPYAAAILLITFLGIWGFFGDQLLNHKTAIVDTHDIAPGGNKATLTLADGQTIVLDETRTGIIVRNEDITYSDGTTQVAILDRVEVSSTPETLTLITPKGGTYQITLPDGSQVWLNANSALKYPSHFTGNERLVEISGEAYFSVARNKDKPFKVISRGQQIEVLGTGFNVSAYPDDAEVKTTLVEGTVQIVNLTSKIVNKLLPGEQSITQEATTAVRQVDPNQYIAWKDGRFYFDHTPFDEMIRQVARWYDIEVVYSKGIPKETFTGEMARDLTLQATLDLLDISDAVISLEGRTLIVQ